MESDEDEMNEQQPFMPQTADNIGGAGMKLDPERLKYITATFAAPQLGLGFAAFGAAYAASQMLDLYWRGSRWSILGVLLLASPFAAWFLYLRKYYASRFGWVQQKLPPVSPGWEVGLVILFGLLFTVWLVANMLPSLVVAPVSFLTLMQSLGFLCLIFYSAFTVRGQTMRARLTIWAALAAAQGLVAVLPLWVSLDPRQMVLWKMLNAGSLGILIMVMGLCNHVAMLRLLPKIAAEDDHE
jgi:hypothetical protein